MRYTCKDGLIFGISAEGSVTIMPQGGGLIEKPLHAVSGVKLTGYGRITTDDGHDIIEMHSGVAFILKNGIIKRVEASELKIREIGYRVIEEFLVDIPNNNRVSLMGKTFQRATEMLNSLINCTDCVDCSKLINCHNCVRCTDSHHLNACIDCHGSHDLEGCENQVCASYKNRVTE